MSEKKELHKVNLKVWGVKALILSLWFMVSMWFLGGEWAFFVGLVVWALLEVCFIINNIED